MFPEHALDKEKVKKLAETISVYPEHMFDKKTIHELAVARSKYVDHLHLRDVYLSLLKLSELSHV